MMTKPNLALLMAFFLFTGLQTYAQQLYSKAYGNKADRPIVFVHGGPRGNSVQFEGTTAQQLADKGFYVIVYDRRGEGRSADANAKITYQEAFDDLKVLYKKYGLKKATVLGFSFGGLVAVQFAGKYPAMVQSLVLTSALIAQQKTYDHILSEAKKTYAKNPNAEQSAKLKAVEQLDRQTAEYRKGCFDLASSLGFFKVPHPSAEAQSIYRAYEAGFSKNDVRNDQAPQIFYQNEPQKNIDVSPILQQLKSRKMPIYAIYGKQDGIFSAQQLNDLQKIIGTANFSYLDNASHYLYADQQTQFLESLTHWIRNTQ